MNALETPRLRLLPLSGRQLGLCLHNLPALERDLGFPFAREVVDTSVLRALGIKLKKMSLADPSRYAWYTYWLIVLKAENIGAGLVGFKGFPDEHGSSEIGYGIAPSYQNQGYMTEAVRGLVAWAFNHPSCKKVTAITVKNPASRRVLEKMGFALIEETAEAASWKIDRRSLAA